MSYFQNNLLYKLVPALVFIQVASFYSCGQNINKNETTSNAISDTTIVKTDSITGIGNIEQPATITKDIIKQIDRTNWTLADYITTYTTGQKTEIENYISWLVESWEGIPNPIIAKYIGNDFGDYFHITFEDENENYYDFGHGNNNFGKFPLFENSGDYQDNPKYLNRTFKIYWDWKLSNFPCCDGNYDETEAYIPSIERLELLDSVYLFSEEDKNLRWLVNNYKEPLIEVEKTLHPLDPNNIIQSQYQFETKNSEVTILLIICKNQKDALEIGELNDTNKVDIPLFSVNGNVLNIIIGSDIYDIYDLASWFAGEE